MTRALDAAVERSVFGNEVREIESGWDGTDFSTTGHAVWDETVRMVRSPGAVGYVGGHHRVRRYSESIADAWGVVEKMRHYSQSGTYPFMLREDRYGGSYSGGKWLASFGLYDNAYKEADGGDIEAMNFWPTSNGRIAASDNPATAICLAALAAIGVEVEGVKK